MKTFEVIVKKEIPTDEKPIPVGTVLDATIYQGMGYVIFHHTGWWNVDEEYLVEVDSK